jgi:hypothetical protein
MTQAAPASLLATAAQTAGLGTVGTDLFVGPVRNHSTGMPRRAAFFLDYGAPPPEPYMQTAKASLWSPRVQVTLRDEPKQWDRGETTARAFLEALHRVAISGVVDVLALNGSPTPLGADGDGCPRFTINFQMRVKQR